MAHGPGVLNFGGWKQGTTRNQFRYLASFPKRTQVAFSGFVARVGRLWDWSQGYWATSSENGSSSLVQWNQCFDQEVLVLFLQRKSKTWHAFCPIGPIANEAAMLTAWKKLTRGQSRQSRRWWCCPRFPAAHQHRCESQTHRWPAPRQKNAMLCWTFSRRICIQYPVLVQGLRPNGASVHWYVFICFL